MLLFMPVSNWGSHGIMPDHGWRPRAIALPMVWLHRDAQEESKKLRQKQQDKMKPKMGKLDIDYQAICA